MTLPHDPSNGSHAPVRILVFAASLRKDSLNDRLARLAARCIEERGGIVDYAIMADFDCPSFDQDVGDSEGNPPGAAEFRRRLEVVDGLVIASPEYNGSMPGVLKNSLDWVSRYRPQPFNGRQGLLMSASPSVSGGNRGLWALRVPLEHLGMRVFPDMFSLASAHHAFTPEGDISNPQLRERFANNVTSFLDQVEAVKHYPCIKKAWVEFLGQLPDPAIDRVE